MSEQLDEKGTIVLANSQPRVGSSEDAIVTSQKPVPFRRFIVSRSIVPVDPNESSDWSGAQRLKELIRPIPGMEPSIVNRALRDNINHHPTEQFEIEQTISEDQENLVGDVITAEDGSILSFKEIKQQGNLLPGQVETQSALIPLNSLTREQEAVRVVDESIVSARKQDILDTLKLKKAA